MKSLSRMKDFNFEHIVHTKCMNVVGMTDIPRLTESGYTSDTMLISCTGRDDGDNIRRRPEGSG